MVHYINEEDPDILYSADTNLLIELFGEYFVSQLPRDILIAHRLYQLLPTDDPLYCFNITNCSSLGIDSVPVRPCLDLGPFVKTKYEGLFECMRVHQKPNDSVL